MYCAILILIYYEHDYIKLCVCVCAWTGGLTAVMYTDALQTVVMVAGAFALMFIG